MDKKEAISKLNVLKECAQDILCVPRETLNFKRWVRDTEVAIGKIFGERTRHLQDFKSIHYAPDWFTLEFSECELNEIYSCGINLAITTLESFIDEIKEYWPEEEELPQTLEASSIEKIELIINRFHQIARQLRARYSDRPTIEIKDEHDVQDLFHGLLKLNFDDVRPEEHTPSYAGSASRVDFLLKQEKIIIEIKKTRKNLSAKEVGEQLIIDSQRYQSHPDCSQLICFVYDPEGRIANPRGIENDLTKEINNIPISVFIRPEQ